jgi:hypothetical protein
MNFRTLFHLAMVSSIGTGLASCAAGDAALNHGDLQVQTQMSESVFLDPVAPAEKTIYVTARNTSDHPELDLRSLLQGAMQARGYTLIADPDQAHYRLRINVLQVGPIDSASRGALLSAKYGEPLLGAAAGAELGSLASNGNAGAAIGAGIVAGVGTAVLNSMYKDVTYSAVIDIQLSEKKKGVVHEHSTTVAAQANGGVQRNLGGSTATLNSRTKVQNVDQDQNHADYQIREVAVADKMNLKFEEAVGPLSQKLTSSLSNLFE